LTDLRALRQLCYADILFYTIVGMVCTGWTLNIELAFRFLSVVQTLPLVAWNNTLGLLGLYNGVATDDLMAPDGTVLSPTSSLRSIHDNLGLLCMFA
jgi:von Willebrand factor type D domain